MTISMPKIIFQPTGQGYLRWVDWLVYWLIGWLTS
jgi:hypothetical protein